MPTLGLCLTSMRTRPPMFGVSLGGEDRFPAEDGPKRKKMVPRSLLGPLYLSNKIASMLLIL